MSNTITLADLRTRCRERSDQVNSEFVSPTELLSYINASYAELYDILVSKFEDYYTTSVEDTITTGNTLTLPTDFYKLRGVDYKIDANNWIAAYMFNFAHRNMSDNAFNKTSFIQYRIVGNTLMITPTDKATGTYKLWYTPIYTPLASESDTIDGINNWEEYVVIDVAIKMMAKEESSTTHLEREKVAILKRIETMAQSRDSGQPESITDIGAREHDYSRLF